jgi:hypothetical protein
VTWANTALEALLAVSRAVLLKLKHTAESSGGFYLKVYGLLSSTLDLVSEAPVILLWCRLEDVL